jgi:hypothetical protein
MSDPTHRDPREDAVQCLQDVRTILAQVKPEPHTVVATAHEAALVRIAQTLGFTIEPQDMVAAEGTAA